MKDFLEDVQELAEQILNPQPPHVTNRDDEVKLAQRVHREARRQLEGKPEVPEEDRIYVSHDTTPTVVRPNSAENWTIFTQAVPITNPDGEVVTYARDADVALTIVTALNDILVDKREGEPAPKYAWKLELEDDGSGHRVWYDQLSQRLALSLKEREVSTPDQDDKRGIVWITRKDIQVRPDGFYVQTFDENARTAGREQIGNALAIQLAAHHKMMLHTTVVGPRYTVGMFLGQSLPQG